MERNRWLRRSIRLAVSNAEASGVRQPIWYVLGALMHEAGLPEEEAVQLTEILIQAEREVDDAAE